MRNIVIIILVIGLISMSGCVKPDNKLSITKEGNNIKIVEPTTQDGLNTNKADSATDADSINNLFFFKNNVSELNYKGKFLFNDIAEKEVKLHINKLANLKYGNLFELKIEYVEDVPVERLILEYFYVQNDIIYKIEPSQENLDKLKLGKEITDDSEIVCQDREIKDSLGVDELGWHRYLKVDGDRREYHAYNNKVSTGYYESFIWEKNKGLINYRSGYGAERDSIELQLISD